MEQNADLVTPEPGQHPTATFAMPQKSSAIFIKTLVSIISDVPDWAWGPWRSMGTDFIVEQVRLQRQRFSATRCKEIVSAVKTAFQQRHDFADFLEAHLDADCGAGNAAFRAYMRTHLLSILKQVCLFFQQVLKFPAMLRFPRSGTAGAARGTDGLASVAKMFFSNPHFRLWARQRWELTNNPLPIDGHNERASLERNHEVVRRETLDAERIWWDMFGGSRHASDFITPHEPRQCDVCFELQTYIVRCVDAVGGCTCMPMFSHGGPALCVPCCVNTASRHTQLVARDAFDGSIREVLASTPCPFCRGTINGRNARVVVYKGRPRTAAEDGAEASA